jgi:soluble lytic murein transglycosylase-like protein
MNPAICRGRALDSCLLAAGLTLSACASTGPGAPPSLLPGVASAAAPAAPERAEAAKPAPVRSEAAKSAPARTEATKPTAAKRRAGKPVQPRVVLDSAALERAITKRLAHRPLAMALAPRMRHPELADRVAAAVVYEAGRARINPSVLAGVLVIENSRFDTSAVSTEGAIGLMQVMPMHIGNFRCLSGDLLNVEANICHGARLLHNHLRRSQSIELALRRYNGCVRGRNTPRCQRYPGRVLRTASRIRREILVASASLEGEAAAERRTSLSSLSTLPPDLDADSVASAANEAAQCDSFRGCLRNRWTKPR